MYSFVFAVLTGLVACDDKAKTAAEAQAAYQQAHKKYLDSMAKTHTLMDTLKTKVTSLRGHTADFKRDQMAKVALIQQEKSTDHQNLEKIVEEAESKIAAIMAHSSSLLETNPDQLNAPLINSDHLKDVKKNLISALDKLKAFQLPSEPKSFLEVSSHTPLVPARTHPQFMMHMSRPGQRTSRDSEQRETPHSILDSSDASLAQQRSSVAPGSGSTFACTSLKHHYEHGYQVRASAAVIVTIARGVIRLCNSY